MDLMNMYGGSLYCIAAELARRSDRNEKRVQKAICMKYGLPLENMTDSEVKQINQMVNEMLYH